MANSFNGLSFEELKNFLDEKALSYNNPDFITEDPIGLVRRFEDTKDREIMGLITATIAWGNRKSILKSGEKLIQLFGFSPYEFVQNYSPKQSKNLNFVHRTFQSEDLDYFIRILQKAYSEFDSISSLFNDNTEVPSVKSRIMNFRSYCMQIEHHQRSEKHISNPDKGSSSKRLNMFLRWMVRQDNNGVDLGLWSNISMSELNVPLDVHTGNIARKLGLITRNANDWKALEELMGFLRKMDPKDPSKYDFALFGLGVNEDF
ncbi:MAG: hypothetical protein ACI9XP_000948 [Lentimonas sp.]|jgi:uncharacterized protein (TIGR02757 family)